MPQSVLYLLPEELPVSYEAIGGMQQTAIEKKLPFAVVYQLRERTDDLEGKITLLKQAETALADKHIPLILLLGPSEPILKSLIRHAEAELYTDSPTDSPLGVHPHSWPGNVRSIAELQPIIDTMISGEDRTFC